MERIDDRNPELVRVVDQSGKQCLLCYRLSRPEPDLGPGLLQTRLGVLVDFDRCRNIYDYLRNWLNDSTTAPDTPMQYVETAQRARVRSSSAEPILQIGLCPVHRSTVKQ